jgi:hypothetical protein
MERGDGDLFVVRIVLQSHRDRGREVQQFADGALPVAGSGLRASAQRDQGGEAGGSGEVEVGKVPAGRRADEATRLCRATLGPWRSACPCCWCGGAGRQVSATRRR